MSRGRAARTRRRRRAGRPAGPPPDGRRQVDPADRREPGASGAAPARAGLEPWARVGYGLVVAVVLLFVLLASRPGGRLAIGAHRYGPVALGLAVGLVLAVGLARAAIARPVLQRGRLGAWIALGLAFWLASFPLAYPSSHEGHPTRAGLAFPLRGEWTVRWGGERREENPFVLAPDRRFALVLGRDPAAGPAAPEVLAPCAGTVVRLVPPGESGLPLAGPLVVLEIGADEFLFLGPLAPGSPAVGEGDRVEAGAPLGRLAPGEGSFLGPGPHLVLFVQDSPEPGWGEGVPMRLQGWLVNGEAVEGSRPVRGDRVQGGGAGAPVPSR